MPRRIFDIVPVERRGSILALHPNLRAICVGLFVLLRCVFGRLCCVCFCFRLLRLRIVVGSIYGCGDLTIRFVTWRRYHGEGRMLLGWRDWVGERGCQGILTLTSSMGIQNRSTAFSDDVRPIVLRFRLSRYPHDTVSCAVSRRLGRSVYLQNTSQVHNPLSTGKTQVCHEKWVSRGYRFLAS